MRYAEKSGDIRFTDPRPRSSTSSISTIILCDKIVTLSIDRKQGSGMADRLKSTLYGYAKYRGRGHFAFLMHRISGLGTLAFLTIQSRTASTVFFAP